MSRESRQRKRAAKQRSRKTKFWWTLSMGVIASAAAVAFVWQKHPQKEEVKTAVVATNATVQPSTFKHPANIAELCATKTNDLEQCDIALMNLLCAEGLPGAEHLDVMASMNLLGSWTDFVRRSTEQNLYRFRQNPAEFGNSEVIYRMMVLSMALKRDLGVRYNPQFRDLPLVWGAGDNEFFSDSRNCFLHGVLSAERLGTCGTLPVLECAIGRRLGYPLKLVRAKRHFFIRWESPDGKVRQNFECAGDGFGTHPDEYYRTWPELISPEEIQRGDYLKSLSPAEELASFLGQRGLVLMMHRYVWLSLDALTTSHKIAPGDNIIRQAMAYYATTVEQHEADFRADMEQKLVFARDPRNPLAEVDFISDYQRTLLLVERIKHDLKNPLPMPKK